MAEPRSKLERAADAMREDVWTELQHRRVAKRIDEALELRPRRWRWWMAAGVFGLAAATLAVLVLLVPRSAPPDALAPKAAHEPRGTLTVLSDGSKIDLALGGQIQVVRDLPEETRIEVLSGRAEFDVQRRPGRPFVAAIRGVEVRVVGTHFSTELDESRSPGLVRVVVTHGTVDVSAHAGQAIARLHAGDTLEVSLAATPAASASVGVVEAPPRAGTAEPSLQSPLPADASKLFEQGRDARRTGDVQGAVKAYAALLKQFPSDSRVGVAALELGRLRMDSLHAYGAAADAFRHAFAAAPNEGVREDALARLVEAVEAMRNQPTCSAEKARYLARYPSGVHVAAVRGRCSGLRK